MPLTLAIAPREQYLEARISGEFDVREAAETFPALFSSCKLAGATKLLVDYRDVNGDITAVEKIIYAQRGVECILEWLGGRARELKLAYLGNVTHVSSFEPGADLATEAGLAVLVTSNRERALHWLGVKSA